MISLGDTIKFSLSPSKTTDRLSTNVSGVPLDDRNLVRQHKFYHFSSQPYAIYSENVKWGFSFYRLLGLLIFTGRRLAVTISFGYAMAMLFDSYFII